MEARRAAQISGRATTTTAGSRIGTQGRARHGETTMIARRKLGRTNHVEAATITRRELGQGRYGDTASITRRELGRARHGETTSMPRRRLGRARHGDTAMMARKKLGRARHGEVAMITRREQMRARHADAAMITRREHLRARHGDAVIGKYSRLSLGMMAQLGSSLFLQKCRESGEEKRGRHGDTTYAWRHLGRGQWHAGRVTQNDIAVTIAQL